MSNAFAGAWMYTSHEHGKQLLSAAIRSTLLVNGSSRGEPWQSLQ